jgi:hypothetical protein
MRMQPPYIDLFTCTYDYATCHLSEHNATGDLQMTEMTPNQTKTLKAIKTMGKVSASDYDKRTINALFRRGYVTAGTNASNWDWFKITAKGKKALS